MVSRGWLQSPFTRHAPITWTFSKQPCSISKLRITKESKGYHPSLFFDFSGGEWLPISWLANFPCILVKYPVKSRHDTPCATIALRSSLKDEEWMCSCCMFSKVSSQAPMSAAIVLAGHSPWRAARLGSAWDLCRGHVHNRSSEKSSSQPGGASIAVPEIFAAVMFTIARLKRAPPNLEAPPSQQKWSCNTKRMVETLQTIGKKHLSAISWCRISQPSTVSKKKFGTSM